MPRPIRLVFEGMERFGEILDPTMSLDEIADGIEARVRVAADRIVDLTAPYDVFDVLADVHLNEAAHDPETYKETEHEGLASIVEIVAVCLAARGRREGTLAADEAGIRPRPDAIIDELIAVARELIEVGSFLGVLRAIESGREGVASIGLGAVLREVHVRNLSYPHMEEETVRTLMADPVIDATCRAAMGCSGVDIQAVFAAILDLHKEGWKERFASFAMFVDTVQTEMARTEEPGATGNISPETRAQAHRLFGRAWDNTADTAVHGDAVLAVASGLTEEVVAQVRSLTSIEFAARNPGDAAMDFLQGLNPWRTRPLLRSPDGATFPVNSGVLQSSVRPVVEERLKERSDLWAKYSKARGAFVESRALAFLSTVFPTAHVHEGFRYFIPNASASTPETVPSQYTKLVEGDGLLVIDDVAIVVEAKAGSLTDAARRGDPRRLVDDLTKVITSASAQADRTRERILADRGLRLHGGEWLDLRHVREVHTMTVSLDDLSGIATVTANLIQAGLLPSDRVPWTVSLHDLRVIAEVIDRPAELLLYLRRRTDPEVTAFFHAVDELDLFLHFYAGQLYVEPDPTVAEQELPQFGTGRPRARRRRTDQAVTIITSRTDALDAWYAHKLGERQTPAPKPTMNHNRRLGSLVDALTVRGEPGWLAMGATLLDGDVSTQRNFGRYGQDLVGFTREDHRPHSMTVMGGTSADHSFLIVWASLAPTEPPPHTRAKTEKYLQLKKHQTGVARGLALVFDESAQLVWTAYDNRVPGPDEELDRLLPASGLRSIGASTSPRPQRTVRSARVTPKGSPR